MEDTGAQRKLADPKLLETIDKLFELNIGEYVNLPQLLVVGDQSSGKSSVLEGLTDLAFPRDSSLCTRFATQITFRRTAETKVSVSIIPAAGATSDHAEKLRSWKKDGLSSLEPAVFRQVLSEVHEVMGIGQSDSGLTRKSFSDDVFKIEMCGPKQQHLSVVDVPGIFRRETAGLTTRGDMQLVRNMVWSYMKNPRSVILAVIPANVDIATQEILEMAEECDREGQRTLGVLTKPDLVDEGAEHNVVDVVKGRSHVLKLGWSLVKNPGQKELADPKFDRHLGEKQFFNREQPWCKLAKDLVGVDPLRERLVEILGEMIEREFGKVKREVKSRLRKAQKQLNDIGPSRETQAQQMKFLLDLARRFQDVASMALSSHYAKDDVFDHSDSLKLATCFANRNTAFSDDIALWGHKMCFSKKDSSDEASAASSDGFEENKDSDECSTSQIAVEPEGDSASNEGNRLLVDTRQYAFRYDKRKFDELEDIVIRASKISKPDHKADIKTWLTETYNKSRGLELGTFDPSLLAIVWKEQSEKWDDIALGYISDVVCMVHAFIVDLLKAICPDERTLDGVLSVLMDDLVKRYKRGIDHTRFLLYTERSGTPLTTNHYFADNLLKSRQARFKAHLDKVSIDSNEHEGKIVRMTDTAMPMTAASNTQHTVSEIHDILKSYYKVARKRFVDSMVMQSADHFLVTGPETPSKLFSPTFVSELSPEQLDAIAGEEMILRRKRQQLARDIKSLEEGVKVLL